ncbi:thiamine diphosphokinase [Alphaproteobacteria bacterium KMM 3653]|uniref:Thiamine diphosphokinase n=2 Tax=Harenicola maris TaxID=2841044 RepID=A0AAP2G3K4_9RHOB|nr:thiamine diphosphokinase [Harenicola maris]
MPDPVLSSSECITLLGGGAVEAACLDLAMKHAPRVVAADGGADHALRFGVMPEAVIGDFDSITPKTRETLPEERLFPVAEQDSTDFEKCLQRLRAPLVIGVGFLGLRLDHELSVLNTLVRYSAQPCLLLGQEDVAFAAPAALDLDLAVGTRVSLFPFMPVRGESRGLEWPIRGIDFAPGGRIGTSNRATGAVRLSFEGAGMVVILPRACFGAALAGLTG